MAELSSKDNIDLSQHSKNNEYFYKKITLKILKKFWAYSLKLLS